MDDSAKPAGAGRRAPPPDQGNGTTGPVDPKTAEDSLRALLRRIIVDTAVSGWSPEQRLREAFARIDARISAQLAEIMHAPRFLQLEGTWRGLHHLVTGSETGPLLEIRVLNITRRQLLDDLGRDIEFDQRWLFRRVYGDAFYIPEGRPFGALIGDYAFTNHRDDFRLLREIAGVAAVAGAPFISAASPALFDLKDFRDLADVGGLSGIFTHPKYTAWRWLRDCEDSRFLCLTLPRVLARRPYSKDSGDHDSFDFEEAAPGQALPHEHHCWMNGAYVVGALLGRAFAAQGWWGTPCGFDAGGTAADLLPAQTGCAAGGNAAREVPAEIVFSQRHVEELGRLGFLPLIHDHCTGLPAAGNACTVHKPKASDRPEVTADAAIAARLPCIMAMSRFVHCIRVMESCRKGAYMTAADTEKWLTGWIGKYVNADANPTLDTPIRYPLREASIEVRDDGRDTWGYGVTLRLRLEGDVLANPLRRVLRLTWLHR